MIAKLRSREHKATSSARWMNERADEEVRTDDYASGDTAMASNKPHSRTLHYSPSTEVAL